jgi:hypothetical protein
MEEKKDMCTEHCKNLVLAMTLDVRVAIARSDEEASA